MPDPWSLDCREQIALGVPFDIDTTYRAGTRFGPQAIRRISSLYTAYNYEMGVDLRESFVREAGLHMPRVSRPFLLVSSLKLDRLPRNEQEAARCIWKIANEALAVRL